MKTLAAFVAGMIVATALTAEAGPKDVARFKTLGAFPQALATVQNSYVDPVEEKQLVYNAARGMLHNLDQYSTFLPPNRYKNLRQDTEGGCGGVGITLTPGTIDDSRPGLPPFPSIDTVVPRSPADLAGLLPRAPPAAADRHAAGPARRARRRARRAAHGGGRRGAREGDGVGSATARRVGNARLRQRATRRVERPQ